MRFEFYTEALDNVPKLSVDDREMTSAVKFLDNGKTLVASQLQPDDVVSVLQASESLAVGSV